MKNPFIKVWQLLTGTAWAKTLSLVALLVLVAFIPLTLSLVQDSQDIRQQAAGSGPTISGIIFIDTNGNGTKDTGELPYTLIMPVNLRVQGGNDKKTFTDQNGLYVFDNLKLDTNYTVRLDILPTGYTRTTPVKQIQLGQNNRKKTFDVGITNQAPPPGATATPTPTPGESGSRSITCSPTSITLTTQEQTLTATFRNAKGETPNGKTILWRSSLSDNQINISNKSPNTNRSGVVTTKVKAKNQNAVGKTGTVTAVHDNDKNVKCTITLLSGQGGGGEPTATPTTTPTVTIPPGIGQSCPNVPTASMLIIDRSNSMARPAGATRAQMEQDETAATDAEASRDNTKPEKANSKFRAAKEAAKLYVDTLSSNSQGSKIGVVSFANEGRLDTNFSSDFPLVKNKISGLKMKYATCIFCAIKAANSAFATQADQNLKPVVILLTDGIANYLENSKGRNLVSHDKAEKATLDAVKAGYAVNKATYYVIGLGKDVNANFLKQIAETTGGKYYSSPSTEQLNGIYKELAELIGKGSISGYVFSDVNGNKVWDKTSSEKPLASWTIYLKNQSGAIVQQTTSDENGYYVFTKVCSGTYTISEEVQSGYIVTIPPNNRYDVNINSGIILKDKNFGNHTGEPQAEAGLKLDIILHGVGAGGDNPNPNISTLTNKTPLTPVRKLKVQIFDKSGKTVVDTTSDITYNSALGNFTGTISLGDFAPASPNDASAQSGAGTGGGRRGDPTPTDRDRDGGRRGDPTPTDRDKGKKGNGRTNELSCSPKAFKLTTKAKDVTARLRDSDGKPIAGKKIAWDSTIKGGRVEFKPNNPQTDKNGVAKTSVRAKNKNDEGAGGTITATYAQDRKVACKIKVNSTGKDDKGDPTPTLTPAPGDEEEEVDENAFNIKIKTDKYLRKLIPGVHTFEGGTLEIAQFQMIAGDINGDNILSILDYSQIYDCYSDLSPARSCTDAGKKFKADLNDDGKVQQFDYNLFVRELAVQEGD